LLISSKGSKRQQQSSPYLTPEAAATFTTCLESLRAIRRHVPLPFEFRQTAPIVQKDGALDHCLKLAMQAPSSKPIQLILNCGSIEGWRNRRGSTSTIYLSNRIERN
jgi:hypothetical protein